MVMRSLLSCCLAVLVATQAQAGLIVSPTSIIRNDYGVLGAYSDVNIINQGALNTTFTSGVTDYDTYIATNPTHGSNNDSPQWFGTFNNLGPGFIDFDLGSVYNIDRLAFWSNPFRANLSTNVLTSNDPLFGSSTFVGSFSGLTNPSANFDPPVQDIDLLDTTARYVRFDISGFSNDYPSIGEVAFSVSDTSVSSVPEPSSLALFGVGAIGMVLVAVRRRRMNQPEVA